MIFLTHRIVILKAVVAIQLAFVSCSLFVNLAAALEINFEETETQQTLMANKYFSQEDDQLYSLTKKIELKQPITVDEVKALPDEALNKRYKGDITLLFFALNAFNAQAIDVLLAAGADPYMIDAPPKCF